MAIKLPFRILQDDQAANDKINQNEETLCKVKLESRWRRTSSGTTSYIYQVMETGQTTNYSANGSADMSVALGFHEKHGTILYAEAHSKNPYINVNVTDVTQTGLTLTFTPSFVADDATTAATSVTLISAVKISAIVTGTWSAWYMVIASDA